MITFVIFMGKCSSELAATVLDMFIWMTYGLLALAQRPLAESTVSIDDTTINPLSTRNDTHWAFIRMPLVDSACYLLMMIPRKTQIYSNEFSYSMMVPTWSFIFQFAVFSHEFRLEKSTGQICECSHPQLLINNFLFCICLSSFVYIRFFH